MKISAGYLLLIKKSKLNKFEDFLLSKSNAELEFDETLQLKIIDKSQIKPIVSKNLPKNIYYMHDYTDSKNSNNNKSEVLNGFMICPDSIFKCKIYISENHYISDLFNIHQKSYLKLTNFIQFKDKGKFQSFYSDYNSSIEFVMPRMSNFIRIKNLYDFYSNCCSVDNRYVDLIISTDLFFENIAKLDLDIKNGDFVGLIK